MCPSCVCPAEVCVQLAYALLSSGHVKAQMLRGCHGHHPLLLYHYHHHHHHRHHQHQHHQHHRHHHHHSHHCHSCCCWHLTYMYMQGIWGQLGLGDSLDRGNDGSLMGDALPFVQLCA